MKLLSLQKLFNWRRDGQGYTRSLFARSAPKIDAKDKARYAVGIHFNDYRMCCVLLKLQHDDLSVVTYATSYLSPGWVEKAKIINMEALSLQLVKLAENFKAYTHTVAMDLSQSLVTVDSFMYNPEADGSLTEAAEFRAAKIADLGEINFDYFNQSAPEVTGAQSILLVIARNIDIAGRESLAELAHLRVVDLIPVNIARVNAFSYWISYCQPELTQKLIAIYDIDAATTQVMFAQNGRILKTDEINQGLRDLLERFPEFADVDQSQLFELTQDPQFDFAAKQYLIEDLKEKLIQEIYRSIQVFYSQTDLEHSNISHLFLTGIGALPYDIHHTLEQRIDVPVRLVQPIDSLIAAGSGEKRANTAGYTAALGLALGELL